MIIFVNDILNEGVKKESGDLEGFIIIFYEHCLKYYYQQYKQGKSWVNSIIGNSVKLYGYIYKNKKKDVNTCRELNSNLYRLYQKGITKASEETHLNIKKLDKDETILNIFNTVDDIMDFTMLKEWML